jgi:hypothetical protein
VLKINLIDHASFDYRRIRWATSVDDEPESAAG